MNLLRVIDNVHEKELSARELLRNMMVEEYLKENGIADNVTESRKKRIRQRKVERPAKIFLMFDISQTTTVPTTTADKAKSVTSTQPLHGWTTKSKTL